MTQVIKRKPVFKDGHAFPDRTLVMGIVNMTPDSFSDGGKWNTVDAAVERAHLLVEQGADIIDVGGESTRPGSRRLSTEEELARILEAVKTLTQEGIAVSVDTVHAGTAQQVAAAGAAILNDVSGGCYDPDMLRVMADSDAVVVLQHWRGFPGNPDERVLKSDAVPTVIDELQRQVEAALEAGVRRERIVIDPGLGFAKTASISWEVFAGHQQIEEALDLPQLIGASRKRFLQTISGPNANVDDLTRATTAICSAHGTWGVRVHEAVGNVAAVQAASTYCHARMEIE
ncbi:dihydropteroate synthase [Gleimia hominis]|uniref:Dihydropteroate synthase n=1 Tax=Gleimia hominis TaxID=595468 RepID=A0ABU3I9K9_9ACTO|nr:dihydropteroate synthase [Gleimia hominis]MDT3767049.1 dihydropteroate synthase [Gleimia hominis]